jgi:hypothetical protein
VNYRDSAVAGANRAIVVDADLSTVDFAAATADTAPAVADIAPAAVADVRDSGRCENSGTAGQIKPAVEPTTPTAVGDARYGGIAPALRPPVERHLIARGRSRRAGRVRVACSRPKPPENPTGTAEVIDAWTDAVERGRVPMELYDTAGHGGCIEPPPGALVYAPRAEVAALVRAQHPTCAFPQCTVGSRRCELDHVVPFEHHDPVRGGWTIPANLQPLCKAHHDVKSHRYWTCAALPGGVRHWRHRTGLQQITAPENGFAVLECIGRAVAECSVTDPFPVSPAGSIGPAAQSIPAAPPIYTDRLTPGEALDLLYEQTWWERHMTPATIRN